MDPVCLYAIRRQRKKYIHKRKWVHPIKPQRQQNVERLNITELLHCYPDKFQNHTGLTPSRFRNVLERITPMIEKRKTNRGTPYAPMVRLFITLRYLTTGDNYNSIAASCGIGKSTVPQIIYETIQAIWNSLGHEYVKPPTTPDDWDEIIKGFQQKWQFPNCLGAIDLKHFGGVCRPHTGSRYINYRGNFSVVLMATCDAYYRFTTIDVGAYEKQCDIGVLAACKLDKMLEAEGMNRNHRQLPNSIVTLPLCFVGDESFPLRCHLMRPYPMKNLTTQRRIFNSRLSRARRTIENCFGILSARFGVLRTPIFANPDKVANIVKCTVALHNFIRTEEIQDTVVAPIYQMPRNAKLGPISNMYSRVAKETRDQFAIHFMNEIL